MCDKALVILSGGQDSTFCLGLSVRDYGAKNVIALTFNYGQTHARELNAAATVAAFYGVRHEVVDVPGVLLSTSPLTDRTQELEQYETAEQMDKIIGDRVEKTFVPMRNAFFLTLAANRAVAWGCGTLVTGVCQDDNANYPDCRAGFIEAQEEAINAALGLTRLQDQLVIWAPLMYLSKPDQVREGLRVPGVYEAWAHSHTAYDGQYPPIGRDHATVLREAAFEEAGVPDPLVARAVFDGLMDVPHTDNYDIICGDSPLVQSLPVLVAYVTEGQG